MAANAAVDKALDRAEAILMWLLEANVKGITLEKAERALQMTEEQVEKRRAAAKTAVDPLQAEVPSALLCVDGNTTQGALVWHWSCIGVNNSFFKRFLEDLCFTQSYFSFTPFY